MRFSDRLWPVKNLDDLRIFHRFLAWIIKGKVNMNNPHSEYRIRSKFVGKLKNFIQKLENLRGLRNVYVGS